MRRVLLGAMLFSSACGESDALFVPAPAFDGSNFLIEWGADGFVRLQAYTTEQEVLSWPLRAPDNEILRIELSDEAVSQVEPFAALDRDGAVSLVPAEESCTDGRRLDTDRRSYPLGRFDFTLESATAENRNFVSVLPDAYPGLERLRTELEVDGNCGLTRPELTVVPVDQEPQTARYERIVYVGSDRFMLMSEGNLVLVRLESDDTATVLQQLSARSLSVTGFWNLGAFEHPRGWMVVVVGASGLLRFWVAPDHLELIDETPSPQRMVDLDVSEDGEILAVGAAGGIATASSAISAFSFRTLPDVDPLTIERVRFLHGEGRRSAFAVDAGAIFDGDLFRMESLEESMPTGWSILGMASVAGPVGGELWVSGTRGNTVFHRPVGEEWDLDSYPIPVDGNTGCSVMEADCGWSHLGIVVERFAVADEDRFDRRALFAHVSNCDRLPVFMPDLRCATTLRQPSPSPAPSVQDSVQVGRRLVSVGLNGTMFVYDLPP